MKSGNIYLFFQPVKMVPPVTIKWCLKQLVTNKIININVSENSMVGRSGDATVCLTSHKSSRKHAAFVVNIEGNLLLQDLKVSQFYLYLFIYVTKIFICRASMELLLTVRRLRCII